MRERGFLRWRRFRMLEVGKLGMWSRTLKVPRVRGAGERLARRLLQSRLWVGSSRRGTLVLWGFERGSSWRVRRLRRIPREIRRPTTHKISF